MKIRIKFRKYGNMRFVGHLDLMRYFQRAMRRAGIDLAYSEGFNPHPILSFALPLGIGLTSDGEYMDITVNTTQPSYKAIRELNKEMVDGVKITEYVLLPEHAKKAMASVAAADYFVYYKQREDFTQSEILCGVQEYYSDRDAILVTKKSKKGERIVDLKPLIYRMEPCLYNRDTFTPLEGAAYYGGDCRGFFLRLTAGSTDNIRPELVLADFYRYLGMEYDPFNLQFHRLELFETSGGEFLPLIAAGENITFSC